MDYQEAINRHIEECKHRIDVITDFMEANRDADKDECLENIEIFKTAISAMQELLTYKELGTLEEVREAVEKQRVKGPKNVKTEGYRYTDTYRCPTCGGNFSGTGIVNYCYHCGQKLNWSEAV